MILGEMIEVSGRFGNTITCKAKDNYDLKAELFESIKNIKGKIEPIKIEREDGDREPEIIPADDNVKNFFKIIIGMHNRTVFARVLI